MKKLLTICFILCGLFSNVALAEDRSSVKYKTEITEENEKYLKFKTQLINEDGEVIEIKPDTMPEFPGGQKALLKFLRRKIGFPIIAKDRRIPIGRVLLSFVIESDGSIGDTDIHFVSNPIFSEEAIRVIKLMPKWKPAIKDEKPIMFVHFLAINFHYGSVYFQLPDFYKNK